MWDIKWAESSKLQVGLYFFFLNNISFKLMNIKQFNGDLVMMVHMAQYTDAGLAG